MNEVELTKHLWLEYRDQDQAWSDYLDYIEEWNYAYENRLIQTRKDFIFTCLAQRHQTISCGDHQHIFSTMKHKDVIHMENPDSYIDYGSCW